MTTAVEFFTCIQLQKRKKIWIWTLNIIFPITDQFHILCDQVCSAKTQLNETRVSWSHTHTSFSMKWQGRQLAVTNLSHHHSMLVSWCFKPSRSTKEYIWVRVNVQLLRLLSRQYDLHSVLRLSLRHPHPHPYPCQHLQFICRQFQRLSKGRPRAKSVVFSLVFVLILRLLSMWKVSSLFLCVCFDIALIDSLTVFSPSENRLVSLEASQLRQSCASPVQSISHLVAWCWSPSLPRRCYQGETKVISHK